MVSSSVSARFGAAAQTYDLVSGVQRAVAEKLAAFLPQPEAIDSVLEIGCGTGFFTELLAKRFPSASIDAVDISAPMIDSARKRIGECSRLRWHTADARKFYPGREFALIASSSALHWITPPEEIMYRIAAMLEPGGSLASALMVEGTLGELSAARARLFPHKSAPVRLPSVEEILQAISAAGLTIGEYRCEALHETCASTRELLRSLNRQGVTGRPEGGEQPQPGSPCPEARWLRRRADNSSACHHAPNGHGPATAEGRGVFGLAAPAPAPRRAASSLLNRTELLKLGEYYDRQFPAPQGGVIATYRVLYVTARKEK